MIDTRVQAPTVAKYMQPLQSKCDAYNEIIMYDHF